MLGDQGTVGVPCIQLADTFGDASQGKAAIDGSALQFNISKRAVASPLQADALVPDNGAVETLQLANAGDFITGNFAGTIYRRYRDCLAAVGVTRALNTSWGAVIPLPLVTTRQIGETTDVESIMTSKTASAVDGVSVRT